MKFARHSTLEVRSFRHYSLSPSVIGLWSCWVPGGDVQIWMLLV